MTAAGNRAQSPSELSLVMQWLIPVVAVALAQLSNVIIPNGVFAPPFFITAVMITAHLAGTPQAVLAFVLAGATLDYFNIPPFHSFSIRPDLLPSLLQFVVPCALGVWFVRARKLTERLLERETEVGKRLQGELSLSEIGSAVLSYLAPELDSPIAAFYSVGQDGSAIRRAAHAFDLALAPEIIPPGHGVIGQAIADAQHRVVSVPPDYVTVRSSLGYRKPSKIVIFPAKEAGNTRAVLEFGFFGSVTPEVLRLFERIAEPVAIAVRSTLFRTRLQDLLEETRRQAEELKTHDEELRSSNEELEERGRAMYEAQRALEQQQAELEQSNQLLREQTSLLEQKNDELARAQEIARLRSQEADHANRAKSEFLANMSHELRTPLNSSLILAKLLMENRDGNLNADQIRFAETIYSAGNDLLAIPITRSRLDLRPLAERVFEEHQLAAPARAMSLLIRGNLEGDWDATRLEQVISNLLGNAVQHGVESASISMELSGDALGVLIEVRNGGVIPRAAMSELFNPFRRRLGGPRTDGLGLGLFIVQQIALAHGGRVDAESSESEGTLFRVRLPRELSAPSETV